MTLALRSGCCAFQTNLELSQNSTAKMVSSLMPVFWVSGGQSGDTCWQASQAPSAPGDHGHTNEAKGDAGLEGGQVTPDAGHAFLRRLKNLMLGMR